MKTQRLFRPNSGVFEVRFNPKAVSKILGKFIAQVNKDNGIKRIPRKKKKSVKKMLCMTGLTFEMDKQGL